MGLGRKKVSEVECEVTVGRSCSEVDAVEVYWERKRGRRERRGCKMITGDWTNGGSGEKRDCKKRTSAATAVVQGERRPALLGWKGIRWSEAEAFCRR
jgi:hypothetical protein